jgi:dipeptidase E
MVEHVLALTGRPAVGLAVLYVGTATYDAEEPRTSQLERFVALGCRVSTLEVATAALPPAVMRELVEAASVIVVSGGNTLYAVDRWMRLGLDGLLRAAVGRGAVVCGGSAGAICWFDGGHSDSMDPTSFRDPLPADDPRAREWSYIRVDGLGLLPGLLCPHYDRTQANGVPRAADFAAMLRRHPGEDGLGLDHWAGLLIDGPRYAVVAPVGREGSMRAGRFVDDGSGVPGLWACEAGGGASTAFPAPPEGQLTDIVRPARSTEPDPRLTEARLANPVPAD